MVARMKLQRSRFRCLSVVQKIKLFSRLHLPLSRSRSRSPGRWGRKMQSRSRSRSRRRSRTPKKSRSPSKSHKSVRKHKSKSPRPSRIPSPSPHRSRARSPSSITARNLRVQAKISETSLFAELVKDRNMRELAYKKLQAAKEKAVNQDEVQIIEGTDDKDGSNASSENKASTDNKDKYVNHKEQSKTNESMKSVDVVDIPVPVVDDGLSGKTPPLPMMQSVGATNLMPGGNQPPLTIVYTSPTTATSNCPMTITNSPGFPSVTNVQVPPLPHSEPANAAGLPQASMPVPIPVPVPVLPNLSVPPPPIPIPVPAPNTAMSKFNPPNNLVPLKSVDPPKPPIVAFKTKSLSRLPLPPGINQNDLESIDSPPSRSPSPPSKAQMKFPASTPKPPQKKSIKDLPMPPGKPPSSF